MAASAGDNAMAMAMERPPVTPLGWRENPAGLAILLTSVALLVFGVVMVHSAVASVAEPGPWYARRDVRHTLFAGGALILLLLAWRWDYRHLIGRRRLPILLAVLLVLALASVAMVYAPGIGREVGRKWRWIRLGPPEYGIGFQPSELVKLAMVLFLAAWLAHPSARVRSWKTVVPAMGLIGACAAAVIREDFGTGMMIALCGAAAMFLAGVPWYWLLGFLPPGAAGFYLLVMLDNHRWSRITAFLNPWDESNPCTYQARQSLLAIMTGGWFGQGVGHGMVKRGYLPEGATDFIFSVFCEEWGMAGAMLLIALVVVWLWQARRAAVASGDRFGRLLAGSLGFVIAIQMILHIAVDLVAAPPTGIGLPFISAGGTQLLTTAAATALIISVTAHRWREPQDGGRLEIT